MRLNSVSPATLKRQIQSGEYLLRDMEINYETAKETLNDASKEMLQQRLELLRDELKRKKLQLLLVGG